MRSNKVKSIAKCPWSEIRAAYSDLDNGLDLFSCGALDLSASDLLRENLDLLKLCIVELSLLHPVRNDLLSFKDTATGELVQDKTILSGIHHLSAEKSLVFVYELLLISKGLKRIDVFLINRHGTVVV